MAVPKYSYPELDSISLAAAMHALSDEARLEILRQLLAKSDGELCCGEFCGDLAKATVSHHMRVLREAGLIQHRCEGTKSITFLRKKEVAARFPGLWELVGIEKSPCAKYPSEPLKAREELPLQVA